MISKIHELTPQEERTMQAIGKFMAKHQEEAEEFVKLVLPAELGSESMVVHNSDLFEEKLVKKLKKWSGIAWEELELGLTDIVKVGVLQETVAHTRSAIMLLLNIGFSEREIQELYNAYPAGRIKRLLAAILHHYGKDKFKKTLANEKLWMSVEKERNS